MRVFSEDNLYVGTSAAEILHFVFVPTDSADESMTPSFIFASRLQPTCTPSTSNIRSQSGVQQILPLPRARKLCVLCNGTLTFYSLPELSPAFRNTVLSNISWVGGTDLNSPNEANGEIILICSKNRIKLVRIGEQPRTIRNLEFPGCLTLARRENIACVADRSSYALLDIENQQKISLFPISSLDENADSGKVEDIASLAESTGPGDSTPAQPMSQGGPHDFKHHNRNTSLGTLVNAQLQTGSRPESSERLVPENSEFSVGASTPSMTPQPNNSDLSSIDADRPLPVSNGNNIQFPQRTSSLGGSAITVPDTQRLLGPHVYSPSAHEFLLTTGTTPSEPGVGIFVNLDGDVVRGTLEFSRYPSALVIDQSMSEGNSDGSESAESYVLAAIPGSNELQEDCGIEIQRLNASDESRIWMDVYKTQVADGHDEGHIIVDCVGLRVVHTSVTLSSISVGAKLKAERLRLPKPGSNNSVTSEIGRKQKLEDSEVSRNQEESEFAQRLSRQESKIISWFGSSIWCIVKNPLVTRLDSAIEDAVCIRMHESEFLVKDRKKLLQIVGNLKGKDATSETEYISVEYILQKISLILFYDLCCSSPSLPLSTDHAKSVEEVMMAGGIDPRVILYMIPLFREDVVEGPKGIWIHSGLINFAEFLWSNFPASVHSTSQSMDLNNTDVFGLIKRYLMTWRQRKGYGSIANENEVFQTVDATILHLYLHVDNLRLLGSSRLTVSKAELYSIVDSGVDCFDRAVALLEEYQRLYVLSRLYQSRKMANMVLQTWRRIIEGEKDSGNELTDGENEIRKYLVKIKDSSLMHEYGSWLARRNPALGVQVFADESSRIKMKPEEVIRLLRENAPGAVKFYLEYLVFGKKNFQYADELISYYLDSVLSILHTSAEAREILSQSYKAYRALQSPKPTYRQFIIDNGVPVDWWHDRLRLLELLGGSHGAEFSYSLTKILSRVEPFEQELVPESIIIDGRQGRHQQALRLLVHSLGDYHTSVNYCLLGGASIFHPITGSRLLDAVPSEEEQLKLFGYLLEEFLQIEDDSNRLERTSELLNRFGTWYDVGKVLGLIPESWSVELVSGFLTSAFRRLITEKNEALVAKALSGAENLQVALGFIEQCDKLGPQIEKIQ